MSGKSQALLDVSPHGVPSAFVCNVHTGVEGSNVSQMADAQVMPAPHSALSEHALKMQSRLSDVGADDDSSSEKPAFKQKKTVVCSV